MKYELKSVGPGSIFLNAIRIFLVVGFMVGVVSFFLFPNPNIHIELWWQKIAAVFLFTVVYAGVVAVVLCLITFLYNWFSAHFKGVSIEIEQQP